MGYIILIIIAIFMLVISYRDGKRSGLVEANKSGISRGTWIKISSKIIVHTSYKSITLLPGTYAVVTGINHWEQLSIWIADPWTHYYSGIPEIHGIMHYSKIRILNIDNIDSNMVKTTMDKLNEWELKRDSINKKIFETRTQDENSAPN